MSRVPETGRLRDELTGRALLSDEDERALAQQVDWRCIETLKNACPFPDDRALVGQLLLLHRAELDRRILDEPATGFAHRVFPPW
jgi:hypothetical protein